MNEKVALYRSFVQPTQSTSPMTWFPSFLVVVPISCLSGPAVDNGYPCPELIRNAVWQHLTPTEHLSNMPGCVNCIIYVEKLSLSRRFMFPSSFLDDDAGWPTTCIT